MNEVSPHEFKPMRRFFNRGRCRACYAHEDLHPVRLWLEARPLGDKKLPLVSLKGQVAA